LLSKGILLNNESETKELARKIAPLLSAPFVIALQGDIGTGKTTLVRALLQALNVRENIKSPTFSLVETYELPQINCDFHHFDLYRLEEEPSLTTLGFSDYFTPYAICCIEWHERSKSLLASVDLLLKFEWLPEKRRVTLTSLSLKALELLQKLEI